jgi:purine nucleoside permease
MMTARSAWARAIRCGLLAISLGVVSLARAAPPLAPKVVVVTMFEPDPSLAPGGVPGELRRWAGREHLDRIWPLPAAAHDARSNADGSILAILTGVGNTNAAASVTALGLDSRFDLRRSYWLVAGIAGGDPADVSLGSAVWTDYVVDGDLAHQIDPREMPAGWPTGYFPLGANRPYETPLPKQPGDACMVYTLDPGLLRWAYQLTRETALPDSDRMRKRRARYQDTPNARRAPFVATGANLSASNYWTGRLLNEWANAWVRYYTGGRGNYVTSAMEDSGTLRALTNLQRAGRVDFHRVLVLRTVSDFDMPWPGGTAYEGFRGDESGQYPAYAESLESAYRVGSRVVHALIDGWGHYATKPPGAAN